MRLLGMASAIYNQKNIKSLLIAALICICILPKTAPASAIKDIAVLPFKNISGNSGCNIEDAVTEMLITELAKNKNFHIVERQQR